MNLLKTKERYFKFLIYIVVIILVNVVGLTLFFRIDLTKDNKYSLSKASREVVSTLSDPLTIKVFFTKNLPAPHNNTERYLHDILEEYSATGKQFFNYTFHNVTSEKAGIAQANKNQQLADDYGILPVEIRTVENDELKFKKAYMGLVIIHGDMMETLPAITATEGLEYQLTTAIQKLNNKVSRLSSLKEKIQIKLYLSSSLNIVAPYIGLDDLSILKENITQSIEKLNEKHLQKIDFKYIDPTKEKNISKLFENYDLMHLNWPDIPTKDIAKGKGSAGIVIEFKDKTESFPIITAIEIPILGTQYQTITEEELSEKTSSIMETMIGINQEIGYLAGHGSPGLMPDRMAMMQGQSQNTLNIFNQLLSKRYSVNSINLKTNDIPEGLKSLVIAGPVEEFSDNELYKIDQALMRGTNIAFFTDAIEEKMPQQQGMYGAGPQYKPVNTGIEKLLLHYGVKLEQAYLLDENCYNQVMPKERGGGEQKIYFIPMIGKESINNSPLYMNNIRGLATMRMSPLEIVKENIDNEKIKVSRLFSSSSKAWLIKDKISLNPVLLKPPVAKDEMKSYPLAYMLEGKFTSFFKGKKIPEKQLEKADINEQDISEETAPKLDGLSASNKIIEQGENAKIFVIASSALLSDQLLDIEGTTTNATFILNIIDHLNDHDNIAAMRSKQQSFNPLIETTPFIRNLIKSLNIAVLPCLVILFGFIVLLKRSLRKKKIKQSFAKQ
ncbi:MAG: GldG family protein [Desulfobacteraceae bacterium]|nr:GldG family protein [Desulfobacteraceae bacterium]